MPMPCRTSYLVVLAFVSTACSSATAPNEPRATVVVQREKLVATSVTAGSVTWLQFEVPIAIENAGRVALTFVGCATTIEARSGGGWDTIWAPICVTGTASPLVIAPGETRELTFTVVAATAGPGGPEWRAAGIGGSYRLVAGLIPPNTGGRIPKVPSSVFTLAGGS
jgi:hypothetical protein